MSRFQFPAHAYSGCTIFADVEGFRVAVTIFADDCGDKPDERSDGFWPSRDPEAAGYVLPKNYKAEMAKAERVMQAWKDGDWFYCGAALTVALPSGVQLTGTYDNALWGVECNYPDSDNSYLGEVAEELLGEALDAARAKVASIVDELRALAA